MKKLLYSFLILPLLVFSNHAISQDKMFMKVSAPGYNFNGGVTDVGYQNQIEVFSFSDGMQGCATTSLGSSAAAACKTSPTSFQFITSLSLATIDFRSAMLQGKVLNSVDFVVTKSSGGAQMVYYKIHMENVLISSLQEGGAQGGGNPSISISLSPTRIAWEVITQSTTGATGPSSSYGWDFSKNTVFNYTFN